MCKASGTLRESGITISNLEAGLHGDIPPQLIRARQRRVGRGVQAQVPRGRRSVRTTDRERAFRPRIDRPREPAGSRTATRRPGLALDVLKGCALPRLLAAPRRRFDNQGSTCLWCCEYEDDVKDNATWPVFWHWASRRLQLTFLGSA